MHDTSYLPHLVSKLTNSIKCVVSVFFSSSFNFQEVETKSR